jgi:deoxycytidine triphosphate deaminase
MTTLSDRSIREKLIPEEDVAEAKEWFKKGEWGKIDGRILIHPFDRNMVGPFSYDLTIGDEAKLLRTGEEKNVKEEKKLRIDPGDTVLVLTQEYVGLPEKISGIVEPRARLLFDGLIVFASKVDPTWHGKLAITIKNNSNTTQTLSYGEQFCTLIFNELDKPTEKVLTKDRVPFLGQESLISRPTHATPWTPRREESVHEEDLDKIIDEFGPPFDVIRGIFKLEEKRIKKYIEEDWGRHLLREFGHEATAKAFSYLKWVTSALVIALLGMVIALLTIAIKLL